ncbi:MAG TPA: O-methyltransferase [Candidatus Eisenbacteria bacterium]|nr:O-methyltransferase [Candidatus Eisenbacteria bacterium]
MKAPPYHLRPNKAVDRLTLIDAIKLVVAQTELGEYTYYGMGGPYLEDFRLMYELYPHMRMVCIEKDENVCKRQLFHLPCRSHRLRLEKMPLSSFLAKYEAKDEKSIFWLDYTKLRFSYLDEFMDLLGKVGANSLIKITLRCNPPDYQDTQPAEQTKKLERFKRTFETVLPTAFSALPVKLEDFALLIQNMVRIASQKALPSATPTMFLPIASFYYSDSSGIFTLTGIVCLRKEMSRFRELFKRWQFANLDWVAPKEINVPSLSTKERLHLQRHLPRRKNAGRRLLRSLGYLIDRDEATTEIQLQQYADFHRYFPYFIKAIP